MKKLYSIGYVDNYNNFSKIWENGETKKFISVEDCKQFIENDKKYYYDLSVNHEYRIMQGWKVIKTIKL